ncbi:putative ALANIN-rich signal peptide protein [Collimonas arenae]|uniref:Putative ALANIN-rich signal peptide protein n=2 Tax=Collimonas arenae TaxID=279058 RepID=A0A0A1FFP4_9BURK|nr:putative ALANIN-rich signal peptide protein [Collimonas arenae]
MEKKMKALFISAAVAAALLTSAASFAQAPAAAPAGSTGLCKDGSYSSNATKKGACAGHKGVKTWYAPAAAAAAAPATTPAAAPATTPAAAPAAAPAAMAKPAAPAAMAPAKPAAAAAAPAAGANPGDVWVNSSSKVYHCAGSKYYGKTKAGSYMTEAAAKAAGNHADHGKACS